VKSHPAIHNDPVNPCCSARVFCMAAPAGWS